MAKSPLEALKQKYMNDPDIIPAKGEDKEPIAEAMAKQQIRQRENNDRAFELLTKAGSNEVDSGSSGGAKEGGDAAMYRLTEFVNKPVEKNSQLDRKIWGEPKKKHLEIMNRPFEVIKKEDADKISLEPPPIFDSEEHQQEIEDIKSLKNLLDEEAILERIEKQDADILAPFNRYLRENNLELDREEFMKIMRDVNTIIFKLKYYFNRPRPHQYSDLDEIENIGGKSPSYPSGHSTTGAVIAEMLSAQFPEHAESFRVIGTELGYNRVIAGLHHMSDHLAGLNLASQILPLVIDTKITKSDEFMGELFKYMAHRQSLLKDMTQIGTQDILDGVRIDKESNPRVPRKKGQPAKSKKHSDLYTDEDPKGTIQGLGFKDDKTARASVKKIKNSNRTHAHKIQAAVAMEQRAKAAGKSSEAGIYRKYINSMKEKTKRLEKHTEEEHVQEHNASDNLYPKVSVDKSKKSLLDQIDQIQSKITTGDYDIKKSDDIFLLKQDYDFTKKLTKKEFDKLIQNEDDYEDYTGQLYEFMVSQYQPAGLIGADTKPKRDAVDGALTELSDIEESKNAYSKYEQLWDAGPKVILDVINTQSTEATAKTSKAGQKKTTAKKTTAKKTTSKKKTEDNKETEDTAAKKQAEKIEQRVFDEARKDTEAQFAGPQADEGLSVPGFKVLGAMTEFGYIGNKRNQNIITAVLQSDADGSIHIASQNKAISGGLFGPSDGFAAYNYGDGTQLLHANTAYKVGKTSPVNHGDLDKIQDELRKIAVSHNDLKDATGSSVEKGVGEANLFNAWIKQTVENAGGTWNLPEGYQNLIDNPVDRESFTKAAIELFKPTEEEPITEETASGDAVNEEAANEQGGIDDTSDNNQDDDAETITFDEASDNRQGLITQARNSGLLDHIHSVVRRHGEDNEFQTVDNTVSRLLGKYKTEADLREYLGEQSEAFKQFKEKQRTDAEKLITAEEDKARTAAQEQIAAETAAQQESDVNNIAQKIVDEVNEMPTLFRKDSKGNIAAEPTATNPNMADRYRRLVKLFELHDGTEPVDVETKKQVQDAIRKIDPTVMEKVDVDKNGLILNLPKSVAKQLDAELERPDYHEDSHKAEITADRQQSAAEEAQHKANMDKTHKERLDGELFNNDAHKDHQSFKQWGSEDDFKNDIQNFTNETNQKYGGQASKSDLDRERREKGLPPEGDVPTDKNGKPYLWHAGTHHWVTPEYIKVHGDLGAGVVRGDVVTGLENIKDSAGNKAFIPVGDGAKNGIAALKANANQGFGGNTDIILTSKQTTKNQHGYVDFSNIDYHADAESAAHAHEKNLYVEKHLAEGKNRTKTDTTGRVLTEDVGNTALQRYSSIFKEAGGFGGALARFTAAVLPKSLGGGLTQEQAAKY